MALLLPLYGEGCSFELLLSSSTWSYKALQYSAVLMVTHWWFKSFLSPVPALREWGEDGVSISLPGSDWSAWLGAQDEGAGVLSWEVEPLMTCEPFLCWSELLRTPTVPPLLRWSAAGVLSEAKRFGRLQVQCALLFGLLLQGESIYWGGMGWNFW